MLKRRVNSPRRTVAMRTKLGRKLMGQALDQLAEQTIKPKFYDVVSDWDTDVKFVKTTKLGYRELRVEVRPHKNKAIFTYVDKGTRPHKIKPKKRRPKSATKANLVFRTDYSARTAPIAQAHVGSGRATGDLVFAKEVNHPGSAARKFSATIHDEALPEFRRITENVFRKLARSMHK